MCRCSRRESSRRVRADRAKRGQRRRRHAVDRRPQRRHYILNGSKIFITHGGVGEIFVVTARDRSRQGNEGNQLFHRDEGSERSRKGPGTSASVTTIRCRDARISSGEEGRQARLASIGHAVARSSRTSRCPPRICSERRVRGSTISCALSTREESASLLFHSASRRERSSIRFVIRRCESSSASRSRTFREFSSSFPIWQRKSRPENISCFTPRGWRRTSSHSASRRRSPSCSAPSWQCGRRSRPSRSTAVTGTPKNIPSSVCSEMRRSARSGKGLPRSNAWLSRDTY